MERATSMPIKPFTEIPKAARNAWCLPTNKLEQSISDADLKTYIENGLGIITFFGHSSGEVLNVDINDPSIYNNQDRYPFAVTGSCSVGDVHNYYNAPATLPSAT
ncbi:MAG: hypothetical protein IPN94_12145 [Sphingobacteriales bacterium]|nr:hypothetical protein [Sphingobacteriales bacterium]